MKLSFKFQPHFSDEQLSIIEELLFHTSKLYNIANYACREEEFKSYLKLEKELKSNWHRTFLHSHSYQHCLKVLEQDWKSFFASTKEFQKHPEKFKGMPKPPKYKDQYYRKNQIVFTNLAVRVRENQLLLSLSKAMQAKFAVKSLNFELSEAVQKHVNFNALQDYKKKITEEQEKTLLRHCNRYEVKPLICAWYTDWEDFCSDWCDGVGYTRTQARKIYHGGQGEFCTFSNGEIVRLIM